MAKFQARYSSAQNAAVIAAGLDLGWSGAEISRAAGAGELPEPGAGRTLDAFTIPPATARDKVGDERRRRHAQELAEHGAGAELAELTGELMTSARREVERIKRAQDRGPVDASRIREAARMLREVAGLARDMERRPIGGKQA